MPNANTEHTRELECGCQYTTLHHPDGELLEFSLQICEQHMDISYKEAMIYLNGAQAQLTLPLSSPEGDRGPAV